MEYRKGILYETWKDKVKDYLTLTGVMLPGLVGLWCWGALIGASLNERYPNEQDKTQIQVEERNIQTESKLINILEKP